MGQIVYQPGQNGISNQDDDWNCRSRALGGKSRICAGRNDQVDFKTDEFLRRLIEQFGSVANVPAFENQILVFDPPEVTQRGSRRRRMQFRRCWRPTHAQDPDASDRR
jgi:hypothetical protein